MKIGVGWVSTSDLDEAWEIYKHLVDVKDPNAEFVMSNMMDGIRHGHRDCMVYIYASSSVSLKALQFPDQTRIEDSL